MSVDLCSLLTCDQALLSAETLLRLNLSYDGIFNSAHGFPVVVCAGANDEQSAFITCDNFDLSTETLMKMLFRNDYLIRTVSVGGLSPVACDKIYSAQELFRKSLVITTNGCVAMRVFAATSATALMDCNQGLAARPSFYANEDGSIVAIGVYQTSYDDIQDTPECGSIKYFQAISAVSMYKDSNNNGQYLIAAKLLPI